MKKRKKEYAINKNKYVVLTAIIVFLFILFQIVANIYYFTQRRNIGIENKSKISAATFKMEGEKTLNSKEVKNPYCIVVEGKNSEISTSIIEKGLESSKKTYKTYEKFSSITEDMIKTAEMIIVNGEDFVNIKEAEQLRYYLEQGVNVIFSTLPSQKFIEEAQLEEILGIKQMWETEEQEGVRFLQGFMIGGLMEFSQIKYNALKVEVKSTVKTYVSGLIKNQEELKLRNEKLPAVIWRNIYKGSEIYVVNGPFFESNVGYGIFSSILSQIYEDYIYPVINSTTLTFNDFPYFGNENTEELMKKYSRDAIQLQQDILFPDLLSMCKREALIPSFFLTDSFQEKNNKYTEKEYLKELNYYSNEILKIGGEISIANTDNLKNHIEEYQKQLDNQRVSSFMINKYSKDKLDTILQNNVIFSELEGIVGPWIKGENNFQYYTDSTAYIPITIDGITFTDEERLQFYSGITAFGVIVQNLDLGQIIYPKDNRYNWINASKDLKGFINYYRKKFKMIEPRSVTEAAKNVKKFAFNNPIIEYEDSKIQIKADDWYEENYYILRTDKEIKSITSGTFIKIEEGVYLVTANSKEMEIILKPALIAHY